MKEAKVDVKEEEEVIAEATHAEEKEICKVDGHANMVETWQTDKQIKSEDEVVVEQVQVRLEDDVKETEKEGHHKDHVEIGEENKEEQDKDKEEEVIQEDGDNVEGDNVQNQNSTELSQASHHKRRRLSRRQRERRRQEEEARRRQTLIESLRRRISELREQRSRQKLYQLIKLILYSIEAHTHTHTHTHTLINFIQQYSTKHFRDCLN